MVPERAWSPLFFFNLAMKRLQARGSSQPELEPCVPWMSLGQPSVPCEQPLFAEPLPRSLAGGTAQDGWPGPGWTQERARTPVSRLVRAPFFRDRGLHQTSIRLRSRVSDSERPIPAAPRHRATRWPRSSRETAEGPSPSRRGTASLCSFSLGDSRDHAPLVTRSPLRSAVKMA